MTNHTNRSSEVLAAKEPARERGRQRVEALLDAGATLFVEKGYDATTMTDIAARAGASIGSLYQFFPSKEALAESLFARYVERAAGALDSFAERTPTPSPEQIADQLVHMVMEIRTDHQMAAALSSSITGIIERRGTMRDVTRRQVAALLASLNPRLSEEVAGMRALVILQIMKTVSFLADKQEETGEPYVAEVRRLLAIYIKDIGSI